VEFSLQSDRCIPVTYRAQWIEKSKILMMMSALTTGAIDFIIPDDDYILGFQKFEMHISSCFLGLRPFKCDLMEKKKAG
jgi:hypothetical protein